MFYHIKNVYSFKNTNWEKPMLKKVNWGIKRKNVENKTHLYQLY